MKTNRIQISLSYALAGLVVGFVLLLVYTLGIQSWPQTRDEEGYNLVAGHKVKDLMPLGILWTPLVTAAFGVAIGWCSKRARFFDCLTFGMVTLFAVILGLITLQVMGGTLSQTFNAVATEDIR
ncbi:MAG: hypothetical protein EOP04_23405 [Proteobacteria bacterium]|nr:MAG: hypothetical protein EOP04_23405 [Pseudomonadota bacterium]